MTSTGEYLLRMANGASLQEILDDHARELAEKIRAERGNCYSYNHSRECQEKQKPNYFPCSDYTSDDAADLIDPEVTE